MYRKALGSRGLNKCWIVLFLIISAIISSNYVLGVEKVISNSADWRDVYSTMLYASLIGKQPGLFLTSTKHGTILLYSIPKETNGTLIVSSKSQPYTINYKSVMESQGYTDVEELITNTANLDLAKRLSTNNDINKFIIVDDAYGYNALSAASYAVADKYYVLFVNERNIGSIDSFLSGVKPQKIIILGQVDEAVKTRLAKYTPETINEGDRFSNNIEMVNRYLKVKPDSRQILMSNGEFIEASMMTSDNPVIFIGKGTVPTQVVDYIKASNFQVAVLIGNELINSATSIRRQLGISVFVKFAQGSRTPTGPIATVEDLDKFPMPKYAVDLGIYSMMYNKATNALWVTYKNKAGLGVYLKGTITLTDGTTRKVVGDEEPIFIDKNQYKTIAYDVVLDSDNITAKIYTLFGEGKKSLENVLEAEMIVERVEILDNALINITNVEYDKNNQKFIITVENIGTVDSYVSIEAIDLYINGEYITVSSPQAVLIKAGDKTKISLDVQLSDSDIDNNPIIKIKGYYGERENSLIKTVYGEYAFKYKSIDYVTYGLILLIIILILLMILTGKRKCLNCKYKNFRWRKTCAKCGHPIRFNQTIYHYNRVQEDEQPKYSDNTHHSHHNEKKE
jgi:archaellum component FlaF (FlaF/FlaG flagellin family)